MFCLGSGKHVLSVSIPGNRDTVFFVGFSPLPGVPGICQFLATARVNFRDIYKYLTKVDKLLY